MYKIIKKKEAQKNDTIRRLNNENEKLKADLEYVAMMADVELDEEGDEGGTLEEV